jgi:site-specific recombinase XerD
VIEAFSLPDSQKDYFDSSFKEKGSFGIRVNKGGTRTFFLIYHDGTCKKRVTLGRYPEINTKEARSKAVSLIRRIRLSKAIQLPEKKSKESEEISLCSLSAKFLHYSRISGRSDKTLKEYQRLLNKEILPVLGEYEIKALKKHHFLEIYEDILLKRGKRVLANRVRSLLLRIFQFAVEREMRVTNPLHKISRVPELKGSLQSLSLEELGKLFFLLQSKSSESASAVLFSVLTAQPLRMVCNATWDDFIQGYWQIRLQNVQDLTTSVSDTTTDSYRYLHLNELARSLLNLKFETKKGHYVFSSRNGEPLKYIEKSVRQFGHEININSQLTVGMIRRSISNLLQEHSDKISPPLSEIEISQLLYPGKLKYSNNRHGSKTVDINIKTGTRASILLEAILLNDFSNLKQEKPEETSRVNNVIFIPQDKWKRR